jgi:hypothetical protein
MIIRVAHRKGYTVASNRAIRDPRLSFKATGMLIYLLSMADDTRIGYRALAEAKREGEYAVLAALRELQACGYLTREVTRDQRGHWVTEFTLREVPAAVIAARKGLPPAAVTRPRKPRQYEVLKTAHPAACAGCGLFMHKPNPRGAWVCEDCAALA